MTFEEWVNARPAKQIHELASKKDDDYMLAVIRMAQEDMRERAALICDNYAKTVRDPFGGIEQGYKNACDDLSVSIRNLLIEV